MDDLTTLTTTADAARAALTDYLSKPAFDAVASFVAEKLLEKLHGEDVAISYSMRQPYIELRTGDFCVTLAGVDVIAHVELMMALGVSDHVPAGDLMLIGLREFRKPVKE